MNRVIITAIGVDKPGLVDEISSIINQNNGNIENSKMIKIDDQFAMIIDFSSIENINIITTKLKKIKNLEITYKTTQNLKSSKKDYKKYLIKGDDDQGIVNKVSNLLSENNLNIIELNTFIEPAPITGAPLFNMEIMISENQKNEVNNVDSKLISLCENLNLDIKIL